MPGSERKAKIQQRVSILNGMLFLLGAYDLYSNSRWIFAGILIAAGIINILAGIRRGQSGKLAPFTRIAVPVMNIVVAIIIAVNYFQSGTTYIQYLWIFIACISFLPLWLAIRKSPTT